jgi:hypothetical protein
MRTAKGVFGTAPHLWTPPPELELQIVAPSPYTKRAPAPPNAQKRFSSRRHLVQLLLL